MEADRKRWSLGPDPITGPAKVATRSTTRPEATGTAASLWQASDGSPTTRSWPRDHALHRGDESASAPPASAQELGRPPSPTNDSDAATCSFAAVALHYVC